MKPINKPCQHCCGHKFGGLHPSMYYPRGTGHRKCSVCDLIIEDSLREGEEYETN